MALAAQRTGAAASDGQTGPAGTSRWTPRTLAQWGLIALPVLLLAVQGWRHRYIVDDGFIYLRIISNVLDGDGPVFNVGERVEVYTGVLWVAAVALGGLLTPFALEWVAVGLGLAFTVAGVVLGMLGARRLFSPAAPGGHDTGRVFWMPVGALVLAVLPPMWNFATTGLETGLTFGWLGLALFLLAGWAGRGCEAGPPAGWVLLVLGLGPLVRPELAITSVLFVGLVLVATWRRTTWPGRAGVLVWAFALPAVYQLFRMGYFGELVANTAIAKEGTRPRPDMGLRYLNNFVSIYWLWLPVLALLFGAYLPAVMGWWRDRAATRRLAVLLVFPASALVNAGFVILMGGDYLHARLLLPALFAGVIPVAMLPLTRRFAVSLVTLPWALVCLLALRPPSTLFPFDDVAGDGTVTAQQFGYFPGSPATAWLATDGLYMKSVFQYEPHLLQVPTQPQVVLPTLVAGGIGLDGYYFGDRLTIFDLNGLATPLASHMELTRRGHPGHEKSLPTPWVIASLTEPGTDVAAFDEIQAERAEASKFYGPLIPIVTGDQLARQTAWARAALACPELAEFVAAPQRPLTPAVVWQNITGAPHRTQLRISADPEAAYRQFCGEGTPPEVAALDAVS